MSSPARTIRRKLTSSWMGAAFRIAPWLPAGAIDGLAATFSVLGPLTPVIHGIVRRNMQSAGVFRRQILNDYFAEVGRHFANAAHILRLSRRPHQVADFARDNVLLDGSIDHVREAVSKGRGAILAPAHVSNYLLTLSRLGQEFPISVYLRWSADTRRLEMKRAWCAAAGLQVILEPANASDPTSRAAACVDALRAGRVLVMTPDIAQKKAKGIPVQLLARRIWLPAGPASIAMLAEVPLVPVFGRLVDRRHAITARAAIYIRQLSRRDGGRKAALEQAMQQWGIRFEEFLIAHPQLWFLWGDSRWTRIFGGDARYVEAVPALPAESTTAAKIVSTIA